MESIVSFSFPVLHCSFTLNRRGPRKWVSLDDLLNSGTGVPSTVGLPGGVDIVEENIRRSTKFTSVVDFDIEEFDPDLVNLHLKRLVADLPDNTVMWPINEKYDILEYGSGGFFKEHQDKKHKRNHCATLLIFPPAVGKLQHTGGELILDRGRFRFKSSLNTQWTFVAFHTELPHECLPVLTGRRIVFKTELYSKKPVTREITDYPDIVDGNRAIWLDEE
jgi:hypothetical protein